jgi:hypothetical protein
LEEEEFELTHNHYDVFSWWTPYDVAAEHGRYTSSYTVNHYLLAFGGFDQNGAQFFDWAWDPNLPDRPERFTVSEEKAT